MQKAPKELKELPSEPTKKRVTEMWPRQNHERLRARINDIMAQIDREWKKTYHYLSKKGFCILLDEIGLPPGYSSNFADGSTLAQNLAEIAKTDPAIFMNQDGRDVSGHIKNGKTIIFINRERAEAYARQKRSYAYELFAEVNGKKQSYGFAVPK